MKRRETGKQKTKFIEVHCKYCAKTIDTVVDESNLHLSGWKSITKESDDCVETIYLCPDCFSRYKSGENSKSV